MISIYPLSNSMWSR